MTLRGAAGVLAMVALAPACTARPGEARAQPPAAAVAPEQPRRGEPGPVTVDALLQRAPDDGSILLRLSVVRAHPLGARAEPFVLAWPGWGSTIAAITHHPLEELDWIAVVGPRDPARERMATHTTPADDVIDARLRERSDGTLRVVVRGQPHLVVAVPPDGAETVARPLASARLLEPAPDADEALYVDFPEPHRMLRQMPERVRRLVLRAYSRPGGCGEAIARLECDDAASAAAVADEVRARVEAANGVFVRVLTLDLLGGLVVSTDGAVVELRLPATRDQLASLATLASGMLSGDQRKGAFDARQAVPP